MMREPGLMTIGGNGWFRCSCGHSKKFPSPAEGTKYSYDHVCPEYDEVAPTGFGLGRAQNETSDLDE